MKLRSIPEDFVVKEAIGIELSKEKRRYAIFFLQKKGRETLSLIRDIARRNGMPYKAVGFAGIKDKIAVTSQYISIPTKYYTKSFRYEEKDVSLRFVGYNEDPIERGDLIGNEFRITVRGIGKHQIAGIRSSCGSISEGVPNYFDSQRFGSLAGVDDFVAKSLIKKDYEGAVKRHLTSIVPSLNPREKDKRKRLLAAWDKPQIRERIEPHFFLEETWIERFYLVDPVQKEMYVAAYQSYLWNECLKLMLKRSNVATFSVPYAAGSLLFFEKNPGLPKTLQGLAADVELKDYEKEVVASILQKEGISLKELDISETGNYFKKFERETVVFAQDFKFSEPIADEMNKGTYKMTFTFSLPKGSYATIILKRVLRE